MSKNLKQLKRLLFRILFYIISEKKLNFYKINWDKIGHTVAKCRLFYLYRSYY